MIITTNCFEMVHKNAIINENKNILQTYCYEHLHILKNYTLAWQGDFGGVEHACHSIHFIIRSIYLIRLD